MSASSKETSTRIAVFQRKEVRRTLHNSGLWFVIADVVAVLTDPADVRSYVRDMRRRDPELDKGWGTISHPFSF
jgi:DNA-damage-inducible protein D